MRQKLLFILILIGINGLLKAQDAIQIMHYNTLYYGNTTSYCTSTNNAVDMKNENLKIILNHVKPDILTVNEMSGNPIFQDSLLNNALNVDGETKYKRGTLTNTTNNDLVNMLYYNSEKLTLLKQDVIPTTIRPTDVFTLYYNAADLAWTKDTLFLNCIVTHLKAGSASADAATRSTQTALIMSYIQSHDLDGNYLFMGDFNVYTSSETAYQNLIKEYTGVYHLYDPIDAPGDWNNNDAYKAIHTQSSHSTSTGCASTGGLDDRFDFILASGDLMNGTNGFTVDVDSYEALGNDALHFNTSILGSSSAPSDVITALYNASDHLPVLVQLNTEQDYLGLEEADSFAQVMFQNPVNNQLDLRIAFNDASSFEIRVYDLTGRVQVQLPQSEKSLQHQVSIDLANLKSGIYFLQLKAENGEESTHKFFKN